MEISTADGMPLKVEIVATDSEESAGAESESSEPASTESDLSESRESGEATRSESNIKLEPIMSTLTSKPTAADFILEEVSPKFREIEAITGASFDAGTVVSRAAAGDPYGECDPLHTDHAVLYAGVDASAADMNGLVIKRLAILKDNHLTWPDAFVDADIAEVKTAMEAKHLITR